MILSGCLFEMLFTFKVAHDKHSDTITAFQDKRKWKKNPNWYSWETIYNLFAKFESMSFYL